MNHSVFTIWIAIQEIHSFLLFKCVFGSIITMPRSWSELFSDENPIFVPTNRLLRVQLGVHADFSPLTHRNETHGKIRQHTKSIKQKHFDWLKFGMYANNDHDHTYFDTRKKFTRIASCSIFYIYSRLLFDCHQNQRKYLYSEYRSFKHLNQIIIMYAW